MRSKARGEKKGTDKGSSSTGSPDEGVVSGNEAEAAGRNLVYPLLAQAVHKQNKGKGCGHNGPNCIYKLTFPSKKSYVGQTQCITCRFARYKWGQSHNGRAPVACAVKKYGWKNVQKEVLLQGMCEDAMDSEEVRMIKEHETVAPRGYNVQEGGKRHSGYVRRDGPLVKGPRSEATKSSISQGFAERRASIFEGMEDKEEAQRVSACLARDRERQRRYRAQKDAASKEEWAAIAKANRAATWERKREERWEALGWTEEQKVKGRKKVEQQKRAREECERKNPGKRAAESKAYMDVHRKKWNDARPRLTGNLRANCANEQ